MQLLHQYYSYTGFYSFVWQSVKKAFPYIILFVAAVLIVDHYYDINASLVRLTEILPILFIKIYQISVPCRTYNLTGKRNTNNATNHQTERQ